jgi:hypothetical protein
MTKTYKLTNDLLKINGDSNTAKSNRQAAGMVIIRLDQANPICSALLFSGK